MKMVSVDTKGQLSIRLYIYVFAASILQYCYVHE